MLASTLFIEKARDTYEVRDGDKIILRKIHEASPVKVAVEAYNSQSISLLTSEALSLVNDEQDVRQEKAKALKIAIDENGLTVRNVISRFGVWPAIVCNRCPSLLCADRLVTFKQVIWSIGFNTSTLAASVTMTLIPASSVIN